MNIVALLTVKLPALLNLGRQIAVNGNVYLDAWEEVEQLLMEIRQAAAHGKVDERELHAIVDQGIAVYHQVDPMKRAVKDLLG
jgi:hypothetical protein